MMNGGSCLVGYFLVVTSERCSGIVGIVPGAIFGTTHDDAPSIESTCGSTVRYDTVAVVVAIAIASLARGCAVDSLFRLVGRSPREDEGNIGFFAVARSSIVIFIGSAVRTGGPAPRDGTARQHDETAWRDGRHAHHDEL